jgi:hypothetical protein
LRDLIVLDSGGYGYREDPNTAIIFTGGGGTGAIANVTTVISETEINVAFIPSDTITTSQFTRIGNSATNITQIYINDYYANATIITGNSTSLAGISTGDTIQIVAANSNLKLNGSHTVTVANSQYFFITNTNGTPEGAWIGIGNTGFTVKGPLNPFAFFSANVTADINATLANTFKFSAFSTYKIGSVVLNNGGGGYTSLPTVSAKVYMMTL